MRGFLHERKTPHPRFADPLPAAAGRGVSIDQGYRAGERPPDDETSRRILTYRGSMVLFDSVLAWLVSVVGVVTGAAYIPQALRIWKRRSSEDVSILTYLLFLGGQVVYFIYGVRIRQWPLIVGMAANLVGSIAVIASALRFRARK